MKLFEFFSQNTTEPADKENDDQMRKDVMAFILDDNDIYREQLLPLIHKHNKNVKDEDLRKDYAKVINDCCLQFYKEKELKTDPNDLFPKAMRNEMVKQLIKINKENIVTKKKKKDEDTRSVI
jgi:hypothetical protein